MDIVERFKRLCERLGGKIEGSYSEWLGEKYTCVLPNPVRVEMLRYDPSKGIVTLDFGFVREDVPTSFVTVRARPAPFDFVSADLRPSSVAVYEFETSKIVLTVGKSGKTWLDLF